MNENEPATTPIPFTDEEIQTLEREDAGVGKFITIVLTISFTYTVITSIVILMMT